MSHAPNLSSTKSGRPSQSARSRLKRGTAGAWPRPTGKAGQPSPCARRPRSLTPCELPVSWVSGAPTCPVRSTWTTSTPCWSCWAAGSPRPSTAAPRPASCWPRRERAEWCARRASPPRSSGRAAAGTASCATPGRCATLQPLQRLLRPLPRRVDDVQLRVLLPWSDHARGGPAGEARPRVREARARAGPAGAGHRLWLGQLCDSRRARTGRPRDRDHPLRAAGGAGPQAGGRGGCGGPRGHPRGGLPPAERRALRRRGEHRDGRARGQRPDRHLRPAGGPPVRPGGRVLNHGIARLRHGDPEAGAFSERYVFPDAAPLHLSRIVLAFERAGLPVEHVEGLAADYAETLRHWARRFDEHLDDAVRLGGAERVRVWRVYLRAARRGFESGFTSVYQVRCTRPATT